MSVKCIKGSILGFVVGDALGVPYEFKSKLEMSMNPAAGMSDGGWHRQGVGVWSDDSAMTLCTMESLLSGLDYKDICSKFYDWYSSGYWSATGEVFDIGGTTLSSIVRFNSDRLEGNFDVSCGSDSEFDNGNGSLMRTLPIIFYSYGKSREEYIDAVHKCSGLTHNHICSRVSCELYGYLVHSLMDGLDKAEAYSEMCKLGRDSCRGIEALSGLEKLLNGVLPSEKDIVTSGYVIDTLIASIWCFMSTNTYSDCVLKAVNLGGDTDTIAAIAGGLAGLYYGFDSIPEGWLNSIMRKDDILDLVDRFSKSLG